jgi:hypothetical protein
LLVITFIIIIIIIIIIITIVIIAIVTALQPLLGLWPLFQFTDPTHSLGNACYHTVQNLLYSRLLYKNVKIRIYKSIILPVVRYGCKIWSPTLREDHRLRVFENRLLRRILGPKRDEVTGRWRKLHN